MTPPFAASIYWHLPVLLVTFSLVYSATRHDRWDRILWEAAGWGFRVSTFLGLIGGVLFVLSTYPDYWLYLAGGGAVVGLVVFFLPTFTARKAAHH